MKINIKKYVKYLEEHVNQEVTKYEVARSSGIVDNLPPLDHVEWCEIAEAIEDVAYANGFVLDENLNGLMIDDFHPIGYVVRRIDDNECLKMNIDGTDFRFGISLPDRNKNGICKNDGGYAWLNVYVYIKNKYMYLNRMSEDLEVYDIEKIIEVLEKAINKQLTKDEELGFVEPDLEMKIYKNTDGFPSMDFTVFLDPYSDSYNIFLCDEEVLQFYEYLKKTFKDIMRFL